jgi:hypothetical protein
LTRQLKQKEKTMKKSNKTVAELQASRKLHEQDLAVLGTKTDATSKAQITAANAQIESIDFQLEVAERDSVELKAREAKADEAVTAMVSAGAIPPQDTERKAMYRRSFIDTPASIQLHAGKAIEAAAAKTASTELVAGKVAPNAGALTATASSVEEFGIKAGASYSYQPTTAGWSTRDALRGYAKLVLANNKIKPQLGDTSFEDKAHLAIEAANWYSRFLAKELPNWEHIEGYNLNKAAGLQAADYSDPNNNLGVLSGTLVLQRTIPVFKYKYPELLAMMTDFSDTPGVYEQTENTRIVIQPAVQKFNAALNADGRPAGWGTVSAAQTTNVSITLTDYVAVPIAIGNNIIAATTRRLFDEQAVLAIAGIAGYFTTMVTNLMTAANYNYYAAVSGTLVPNAHATYIKGLQQWGMPALNDLDSIFTSAKVPEDGRGLLLNPSYYGALRNDSNLMLLYAASAKSIAGPGDFLSEATLPKLSGFAPYKAGYMPSSTPATNPTSNNVVGFAFQKAGVLLKSRLPTDFSQALGGVMFPGSITTVTDPDTKISLMLVQYINPTQNYAEWRPEVMLGASVADNRAGLVITSQ